jgi:hypothetical protein
MGFGFVSRLIFHFHGFFYHEESEGHEEKSGVKKHRIKELGNY